MINFSDVFMMKSRKRAISETIWEKKLERLIGIILTNTKDWEKGRLHQKNGTVNQAKDTENINDEDLIC